VPIQGWSWSRWPRFAAGDAAAEDYVAHRYHQPGDDYSDAWDWSGIAEDMRLYYRLGRMLASGDNWPNWHKDDEFRAVRDAERGGAAGAGSPNRM
jgi:Zn-dependent M28 family amino/carboxypeptidase